MDISQDGISPFLSVEQAARESQTCPHTIRRRIKDGRLKAIYLSARLIRIRRQDFHSFMCGGVL